MQESMPPDTQLADVGSVLVKKILTGKAKLKRKKRN